MQPGKNGGHIRDAMIGHPQSRNKLGKRGSKNDKVSTYLWEEKARRKEKESKER